MAMRCSAQLIWRLPYAEAASRLSAGQRRKLLSIARQTRSPGRVRDAASATSGRGAKRASAARSPS